MNHGQRWSVEELQKLDETKKMGVYNAHTIAKIMGRTAHSVNAKMAYLKKQGSSYKLKPNQIKLNQADMKYGQKWTEEELQKLEEAKKMGVYNAHTIAHIMDRTTRSVNTKMTFLRKRGRL